ncbi:MAG TPA: CHAD domain-containing protein [Steroidobacteraceae bacterium]|jgi:CHAD domain-containing protein|nr:CHAD domain-containing protein [Steroidobacteraceae bacterium]
MADRPLQTLASPDQPVEQCRGIFLHQVAAAIEALEESKPNVHSARKQLKRARATLRLLRRATGDDSYRRENVAARDAARPLSRARDDEMISNSLAGLLDHFGRNVPRMNFAQHGQKLSAAQIDGIKAALGRSMKRAQEWELDADGWDCITTGLRATYRRARRALRHARTDRATEDLHEWRKQTKYLWHQLQILTPLAPGPIGELADEFHHLADYLGNEHDLAVLRERAAASSELHPLIDRRREELQDKALTLGERLYSEKSRPFVHRLERHWSDT